MSSFTLEPVDWISAGAVGEPGARVFYLQARAGEEWAAVVVEKQQVSALADAARTVLEQAGAPVDESELRVGDLHLEPVVPAWRAEQLVIGADPAGEVFLVEAHEQADLDADAGVLRCVMQRSELVALVADALYAVDPRSWRRCPACGRRLSLDRAHRCARGGGSRRYVV